MGGLRAQTYESATGLLVVRREEAVGPVVLTVGLVLAGLCVGIRIGQRAGAPVPTAALAEPRPLFDV